MEKWSKTHNFSVWVKVFGINFHCFSMNALISTRDDHPFVAIMAFPDKWLSLFDVEKLFKAQDTTSWDTPCLITKGALATDTFKRVEHDAYPGRNKAAAIVASLPAFSNKGVNLQCHVTGLCAVGIIFIAKANDFAIIVNDSIRGHDGSFCIPTNVLNTETRIDKRSTDICIPG